MSEELETDLTEDIGKAVNTASARLANRLLRHAGVILRGRRKRINGFDQRLYDRWHESFDLYELSLYLAQSCGEFFNKRFRSLAKGKNAFKFEALIRLHGNASLIAGEVYQ